MIEDSRQTREIIIERLSNIESELSIMKELRKNILRKKNKDTGTIDLDIKIKEGLKTTYNTWLKSQEE